MNLKAIAKYIQQCIQNIKIFVIYFYGKIINRLDNINLNISNGEKLGKSISTLVLGFLEVTQSQCV